MAELKLFISHSSKTENNIQLLKTVCNGLDNQALTDSNKTISIVYDQDGTIVGGDNWYSTIDQWMLEAHAAVILFSREALFDSDWVKKEASILAWRNNLDPDFVLIPVLLDGLDPKEFDKGLFGVLQIRSRQCIASNGNANEIIAEVKKSLSANMSALNFNHRSFSGCSYEPLEGILAETIATHPSHDAIANSVAHLNLDVPAWPPQAYKQNAIAIARFILESPEDSMSNLIDFLDNVHPPMPRETANNLINYVKGIWVDQSAAAGLLLAWQTQEIIGLNGYEVENYSAKRYCERAWPLSSTPKLININAQSSTMEQVISDIDSILVTSRNDISDQRVQDRIKNAKRIFIILIPARILSEATGNISDRLRQRYKGAILLVNLGSGQYAWLTEQSVEQLSPPLDTNIEQVQFDTYRDARDIFNEHYETY